MRQQMNEMMKRAAMMIAAATMVIGLMAPVSVEAAEVPAAQILAMQTVYPEGTPCTNEANYYYNPAAWSFYGRGCAAFAMQISDAVYGTTAPVSMLRGQTPDSIQVGDIVRISGIHSVVVTGVSADAITVCEGNYNSSVHWGRVITKASLEGQITYIARRG